ncbi:hypothetical protein AB1L88_08780 [Tautonia sp. JC769]|uniref:hypothetical protein n=1 Tax=Tautonia sp. JC769 TaxID=3232135 RepID=UPI0034593674
MDQADRIDRTQDDLDERSADPAPIIIVQRGRATWGRELLLLLLLLGTAGYIAYEQYRGPSIIVRSTPRLEARVVDSVAVAPVSSGEVVLRGSDGLGRDDRSLNEAGVPNTAGDSESGEGSTAESSGVRDRPEGTEVGGGEAPRSEPADEDSTAVEVAGGDRDRDAIGRPVNDPFGFPAVGAGADRSIPDADEGPRRASAVIIWDQDRRDGPEFAPRANEARPDDRPRRIPDEAERSEERPAERTIAIQTLAQRRHFLQCLALAIRQYGRQAGPHIEGLSRDYRIPLPFEVVQLEQRLGANVFLAAGGDLEQTITALRRLGAPESYLLDQLTEQMTRAIGARHGPRNAMEARVFAARKLLGIPLPSGLERQEGSSPATGG